MLLVSGLDVTIVAHYQFSATGYYAVAASVIALMAGLNSTVLSAFLTPQAVLHARGERRRLADVLRRTSRGSSLVNLYIALMAVILGLPLLRMWVGDVYAQRALPVLIILAFAQFIRLAGAPYCMMLISTGQQNKGILNGVVEALVNLTASLWLASRIGYIGVAWGTMIGAIVGLATLILYTVPRTQIVRFNRRSLIDSGLVRPAICLLPLLAYSIACNDTILPLSPAWLLATISSCLALVWLLR
jgi:O-antigen/teichoic acid export membrane protein